MLKKLNKSLCVSFMLEWLFICSFNDMTIKKDMGQIASGCKLKRFRRN